MAERGVGVENNFVFKVKGQEKLTHRGGTIRILPHFYLFRTEIWKQNAPLESRGTPAALSFHIGLALGSFHIRAELGVASYASYVFKTHGVL